MSDPFVQTLISSLLGVIVGSVITVWLTYKVQKKLLRQQLDAQEKTHEELLKAIKTTGDAARFEISSAIAAAALSGSIRT